MPHPNRPAVAAAAAALTALLAGFAASGLRARATVRHPLREWGSVAVPARLDPFPAIERGDYALFPFDRTANSFLLMGSDRPVPEKLVLAVWTPSSRRAAREAAVREAQERTEGVAWRTEGGGFDVGEGVHKVNLAENPAWVVVRDSEERGMTVAYRVWKKAGSLERARRVVAEAQASFRPALTPEAFLDAARERPAKERRARREALDRALAARGVRLAPQGDTAPVEKDGAWYGLYRDDHRGDVFYALRPLGSLPRPAAGGARFEHLRPTPPPGIGNWPAVVWFEETGGKWGCHGIDGDPDLPASLAARVGAGHASSPGGAGRAHFYAIEIGPMEDAEMPPPDLDFFDRASARAAARFRAGEFIR